MVLKDPYMYEEKVLNRLRREYNKYGKLIIAFDWDYTLNNYRGENWEYPRVKSILKEWENRAWFICYTASPETRYEEIKEKLKQEGIPLDYINENVEGLDIPEGVKLYYNILLDDRAGLGESVRVLEKLIKEIKEAESVGKEMEFWEIIKEIAESNVREGTIYKAIDIPISLEIMYSEGELVYKDIMGKEYAGGTVVCSGEMTTKYIKL